MSIGVFVRARFKTGLFRFPSGGPAHAARAVKDIARGEAFTNENVRSIRPAYGVAPKHLDALLGHAAQRDIKFGEPIIQADLESL